MALADVPIWAVPSSLRFGANLLDQRPARFRLSRRRHADLLCAQHGPIEEIAKDAQLVNVGLGVHSPLISVMHGDTQVDGGMLRGV